MIEREGLCQTRKSNNRNSYCYFHAGRTLSYQFAVGLPQIIDWFNLAAVRDRLV